MLYAGGFLLLLLTAGYAAASFVLPYAIIQPRRADHGRLPSDFGLRYEHIKLGTFDGLELDALFVPATVRPRAQLIMLHGINSCKEVYFGVLPELCGMGYNILLLDQRAHGKSGGKYTTYGAKEKLDVCRAVDWLERKSPALRVGIYGNSMGGAVALQALANERRLRFGLIESTFTNLPEITQAYGHRLSGMPLPRWLTDYVLARAGTIADFTPFSIRPVDAAVEIEQPIQLIHGDGDTNIDVGNAHLLYAALSSEDKALHIVPGGNHADLWDVGGNAYREVYFGFLRRMVEG